MNKNKNKVSFRRGRSQPVHRSRRKRRHPFPANDVQRKRRHPFTANDVQRKRRHPFPANDVQRKRRHPFPANDVQPTQSILTCKGMDDGVGKKNCNFGGHTSHLKKDSKNNVVAKRSRGSEGYGGR
jgi:hypothetical protein